MSIRELTDDETARLLTRQQVEALPPGTEIGIKFAGGNGPYRYILGRDQWGDVTILPTDIPGPILGWLDTRQIGPKRWHHRCFLPEAGDDLL